MQSSVFSDHLAELLKHSLALDAAAGTNDDFVELQQLEARIVKAPQTGYYSAAESRALSTIAAKLHAEYRTALKLDA